MPRFRSALVLLALSVPFGACSGGAQVAEGPNPSVSVTMTDFRFSPSELAVVDGATVTIEVRNAGDVVHSWVLLEHGVAVEVMSQFDPSTVLIELEADAGDVADITFDAPPPGTYQVICTITGHLSSGMRGTITVTG